MTKIVPIRPEVHLCNVDSEKRNVNAFSQEVVREAQTIHQFRINALKEAQALLNRALMRESSKGAVESFHRAEKYIHGARSGFGFLIRVRQDLLQRQREAITAKDFHRVPLTNANMLIMAMFTPQQRQEYDEVWLETANKRSEVKLNILDRFADSCNASTFCIFEPLDSKMPLLSSAWTEKLNNVHALV